MYVFLKVKQFLGRFRNFFSIIKIHFKDVIATSNIYNLDLDYRAAAYIIALKKLFWTAYKNSEIYL